jgi:hypothetical protein
MKNVPPPGKVFRPEILSGWKDIAAYLGKGVRTVQRYERELTLPVRRPAGKSAASVIATKAELDGWIAAAPLRKVFQLSPDSASKSGIDTRGALNELKRQVEELRQLRQASVELRAALHESVVSLQQNLRSSLTQESSERRDQGLSVPSRKIQ